MKIEASKEKDNMQITVFEPQYPAELYEKRPNPTAILSPLYDSTFKGIFTQETEESDLALRSFLGAVLGRKIVKVTLKPNEPPKDNRKQKTMTFDVCVEFDNGEISDIEMQSWKQNYDYGQRAEILAARLLSNISKKSKKWEAAKIYQISLINFHYKESDNKEMRWYTMRDESGKTLADRMNIILIDLETIRSKLGTPVDQLTPIEKWGLFFCYVDHISETGYIDALANSEEGIMAADNIVKQMSQADDNWYTQFSVYKAQCDQNTSLYNARQEGLKEGLQKGLQQGMKEGETKKAIESARKMLQKEYSPGDISEITGLPLDHVLELQKKNPEKR